MKKEEEKEEEIRTSTSKSIVFKSSFARLKSSNSMTRPIHRVTSVEKDRGMTDKLHSLMASYIPNDIPSIQKAYPYRHTESSTTFNTLWLVPDSTSRKVTATKL